MASKTDPLRAIERRLRECEAERNALEREISKLRAAALLLTPVRVPSRLLEIPVETAENPTETEGWLGKPAALILLGMSDRSFDKYVQKGIIQKMTSDPIRTGLRGRPRGRFLYQQADIERIVAMRAEVITQRSNVEQSQPEQAQNPDEAKP